MKMEKWLSFAIVSLMMLMVAFNMVGALWMVVLEKKKDIAILKSMGALDHTVRNIFLNEGLLLSLIGVIGGFILALLIYWLQVQFGIVRIPGNFVVNAYPVSIRAFDFMVVFATVLSIGLLASIPPALRAKRVSAVIREE
jgi:lipoprotein-releasing system permease protein